MSLLAIGQLNLEFAGLKVLKGVSLAVESRELLAIIGPNGAGKSSLFNCISGVYRPQSGNIRLNHRSLIGEPAYRVAASGVARVFQNLALFDNLSALDNIMLGRHPRMNSRWWADLLGLPGAIDAEAANRRRVEEVIDFLHLEAWRHHPAGLLPYGVRKRVELGRALAMDPQLLLLDEPAAGLNQEETEDLAAYLLDIRQELNTTVILIEHELGFVMDLADRIAVLDFGELIALDEPAAIRSDPRVIEAYIGAPQESDA